MDLYRAGLLLVRLFGALCLLVGILRLLGSIAAVCAIAWFGPALEEVLDSRLALVTFLSFPILSLLTSVMEIVVGALVLWLGPRIAKFAAKP
jgi:hypothetical protein